MHEYAIQPDFKADDSKQHAGSNWIIHKYLSLSVDIFAINSLRGSSYIPTPEKYSNADCGLINIGNEDAECFRWCMLYHQSEKGPKDFRQLHYKM